MRCCAKGVIMDELKPRLKAILEHHQGKTQAITRRELRHLLELTLSQDRKLRLLIAELRHEGLPVLFHTQTPAGYYMPESLKELQDGMEQLRSYIIDECIVLRSLKVYGHRYIAGDKQAKLL